MKRKFLSGKLIWCALLPVFILYGSQTLKAQEVTIYQYRYVAPDKIAEFIKRETTYWSKVAKNAIDKGTLTFWGLFERVGGSEEKNSPNYLFINTYKDVDGNLGDIWNATAAFPAVPASKIETGSISSTTSTVFLNDVGWQQSAKAVPEKDFNYVVMNYHNASDPSGFVAMENRAWGPFIKSAMDSKQTPQMGWGNSIVLSPTGGDMKFNCVSFDLFPTLKTALMPNWSADAKFPTTGLDSLQKISLSPPATVIYRVVKVESKN
jgi:hypothetical protein